MSSQHGSGSSGTPISILFQILGIDQAKTQLQSIPSEFQKIQQAAKAAGIDLTTLSSNFTKMGQGANSLTPLSTGLQKVTTAENEAAAAVTKTTQSLTQQGQGANTVSTDLSKISQAQTQLGTSANNVTAEIAKQNTTLQAAGTTANTISSSFQKIVQADQELGTVSNTTSAEIAKQNTTLQALGTNINTTSADVAKVATSENELSTSINTTTADLTKQGTTLETLNTETNNAMTAKANAATKENELSTSINTTTADMQKQGATLNEVNSSMSATGSKIQETAGHQRSLKESFEESALPMTTLIASGTSLFETFEEYNQAQVRVQVTEGRAITAHVALQKAQDDLTKTVQKYGENSAAAEVATQKLEAAKLKDESASGKAEIAQNNLNQVTLNFAQEIIPNLLGVGASAAQMYTAFSGTISNWVSSQKEAALASIESKARMVEQTAAAEAYKVEQDLLSVSTKTGTVAQTLQTAGTRDLSLAQKEGAVSSAALGVETKTLGLSFTALSREMLLASLTNPFFIALTVGGAAVAAFATNTLGLRDAINGLGVALGKAVPFLKPILDLMGGLGKFVSSSLGGVTDAQTAYAENTKATMTDAASDYDKLKTDAGKSLADLQLFLQANNDKVDEAKAKLKEFLTGHLTPETNPNVQGPPKPDQQQNKNENAISADQLKGANVGSWYADALKGIQGVTDANGKFVVSQQDVTNHLISAGTPTKYLGDTLGLLAKQLNITQDGNTKLQASGVTLIGTHQALALSNTKVTDSEYQKKLAQLQSNVTQAEQEAQDIKLTQARALLSKETDTAKGTIAVYSAALTDATAIQNIHDAGVAKATSAMKENEVKLLENVATQQEYNSELKTSEGQMLAFGDGALKQYTELTKTTASIHENAGALAVLKAATADGTAQTDAMAAAFSAQEVALEKEKITIAGTAGTVQAMRQEFASGQAQVVAFTKGVTDQDLAMEQSKVKTSELTGTLSELSKQIVSGEATNNAFVEGQLNQRKSVLDSVTALSTAQGTVVEYGKALTTGLPQAVAYDNAIVAQSKAFEDYRVSVATAQGTLVALNSNIGNSVSSIDQFNKGYIDAAVSVGGWIQKINEGNGAIKGNLTEAEYLAKEYSITLPAGFNLTSTEYQNWVKIALGSRDDITKAFDTMSQAGDTAIQKIADSFKKGSVDLNAASKTLSTDLGITFTAGMAEAIKPQLVADTIKPGLTEGFNILSRMDTNSDAAKQMILAFTESINKNVAQAPALKTAGDNIIKLLNDPERISDPQKWLVDLKTAMDAYGSSVSPATKSTEQYNAASTASKGPLQGMTSDVQSLTTAVAAYNLQVQQASQADWLSKAGSGFKNVKSTDSGLGAADPNYKPPTTTSPTSQVTIAPPNTTALDAATTKINTFKALVATIPAAVSVAINGANANFMKLDPAPAEAMQKFLQFAESLKLLPAGVSVAVNGSNANFMKLDPAPAEAMQKFLQFAESLKLLPPGVSTAVQGANTNFAQLAAPIPTVMSTMQTNIANGMTAIVNITRTQINLIPPIFSAASNSAIANMIAIQTRAVTVFAAVAASATANATKIPPTYSSMANSVIANMVAIQTKAATVFNAISNDAVQKAGGISTAFNTMANYVNNLFNYMATAAENAMRRVEAAVATASGTVQNLTNEINAIPDKTYTITAVYKTVGQPQAGQPTFNAEGFGPAIIDHPVTMTVGESGPEYVSVIPLKSASSNFLSPDQRLAKFADPGNEGSNSRVFAANGIYSKLPDIPFTSKEFPSTPHHTEPEHHHRHNPNKDKEPLQPGDYDFENFVDWATSDDKKEFNMKEAIRRLKLPEYSGVKFDKEKDELLGNIRDATHKYHLRLEKEGVYSIYKMYNGRQFSKLPPISPSSFSDSTDLNTSSSSSSSSSTSNNTAVTGSQLMPLGAVINATQNGTDINTTYSNGSSGNNVYSQTQVNTSPGNVSQTQTNDQSNFNSQQDSEISPAAASTTVPDTTPAPVSHHTTKKTRKKPVVAKKTHVSKSRTHSGTTKAQHHTAHKKAHHVAIKKAHHTPITHHSKTTTPTHHHHNNTNSTGSGSGSTAGTVAGSTSSLGNENVNFQQTASGLRGTPINSSNFDNSNDITIKRRASAVSGSGGVPNISDTGSGSSSSSSSSPFDIRAFIDTVKQMIQNAFASTAINLQNVNYIDSNKVYESQKKVINMRNGGMLK